MDVAELAEQQEFIFISSARKQDRVWKNCRKRWKIEMNGETESGKSKVLAYLDDDDEEDKM